MTIENNIPSYVTWFNQDKVHEIEHKAFSDLLGRNEMSETQYKEYRNAMISLYKIKHEAYLSVTICRRNISCDLAILLRIHSFLEHWGIINSTHMPKYKPDHNILFAEVSSKEGSSERPSSLACFSCKIPVASIVGSVFRSKPEAHIKYLCGKCLTTLKQTDHAAASLFEFFKSNQSETIVESLDEVEAKDIELLLNAVEKYGSDWKAIGDAVGTSADAAFQQFLSLSLNSAKPASFEEPISTAGNPYQFSENPSHIFLHILASTLSSSFAAKLAQQSICAENISIPLADNARKMLAQEQENLSVLKQKLVSCSLKRVSLKLKYLEDLEAALIREKSLIERQRLQIFMERINLKKSLICEPSLQPRSFSEGEKSPEFTRM